MPGNSKKESLDEMMADDLDSFSNDLAKMGNQEGYSIFPKSNYQHDGPLPAGQPIHHSHRIEFHVNPFSWVANLPHILVGSVRCRVCTQNSCGSFLLPAHSSFCLQMMAD